MNFRKWQDKDQITVEYQQSNKSAASAMPLLLVALVIILMLAERKVISSISSAVKNDLVKLTLKVVYKTSLFFNWG